MCHLLALTVLYVPSLDLGGEGVEGGAEPLEARVSGVVARRGAAALRRWLGGGVERVKCVYGACERIYAPGRAYLRGLSREAFSGSRRKSGRRRPERARKREIERERE